MTSARPTSPRRPRTPGRPSAGSHDHREALIDAARDRFASAGFAATSLRQIAAAASVSPALAHYYFKDKTGLLEAVVEQRVAPLVQGLGAAVMAAGPEPVKAIRAFVVAYTAMAASNPWLPKLIVREVISEGGTLRETFPRRFAGGMASLLTGVVVAGQQSGVLRADLIAAQVVMSIVSLCIFPFIAAPLVSHTLGIDVSPARAADLAAHHLAVLLDGIAKPP